MRDIAALAAQIALVICIGFLAVSVASVLSAPDTASRPALDIHAGGGIWTTEPVKVNRDRQDFVRLPTPPDPYPMKFRAGGDPVKSRAGSAVRVLANNLIEVEGQKLRLAGVEAVARNAVCTAENGRRFACGLNAYKALENALRGKLVECRVVGEEADERTVECRINGKDLRLLL